MIEAMKSEKYTRGTRE